MSGSMSLMGGMPRNSSIHSKQKKLKGILNNLTPENIKEISEQVIALNIDNLLTLTFLVSQIFEKALTEPTLCEMYANLCFHLVAELPYFIHDNQNITFRRFLLNMCQEQFERGERKQKQEEEEDYKVDEGERRRVLGNIRLIGELYKKKFLTERIVHECIQKLLVEEDVEGLCELMSITGKMIDHPIAKEHMDVYFERMGLLLNDVNLSPRVRFMLKDLIDLRKNNWETWFDAEPDAIASELPERFEIDADIAEKLMSVNVSSHVHEVNPSQSKAVLDDRLDELFLRLENLQCCVRRLEYYHQDASRFSWIILIMLFVLNMLVLLALFLW